MVNEELQRKIADYGNFITRTLEPQLRRAVAERETTEAEINDYIQLQNGLRELLFDDEGQQQQQQQESSSLNNENNNNSAATKTRVLNGLVDIAHSTVFCNVSIPNPNIIYVHVGFGFHVEMTIVEAISFIDRRVAHLQRIVLKHRLDVAKKVAKDVEDALELLEELGGR